MLAAPGIIIIEPLEEDKDSLVLQDKNPTRILKGRVKSIGTYLVTDFGSMLKPPALSVGQVVYYLSYEGDYDNIKENGKKIYLVKFQDLRAYE